MSASVNKPLAYNSAHFSHRVPILLPNTCYWSWENLLLIAIFIDRWNDRLLMVTQFVTLPKLWKWTNGSLQQKQHLNILFPHRPAFNTLHEIHNSLLLRWLILIVNQTEFTITMYQISGHVPGAFLDPLNCSGNSHQVWQHHSVGRITNWVRKRKEASITSHSSLLRDWRCNPTSYIKLLPSWSLSGAQWTPPSCYAPE